MSGEVVRGCRRIVICGIPGAGKTWLGNELSKKLGLPVYHMDEDFGKYLGQGDIESRKPVILGKIDEVSGGAEWIIDGNYPSHTEAFAVRACRADLVLYLNFPIDFCVESIRRRGVANGEPSENVEALVDRVQNYAPLCEKMAEQITKIAGDKVIELRSRAEVEKFLKGVGR